MAAVLPPQQRPGPSPAPVTSTIDYVLSAILLAGLYLSGSGGVPEDRGRYEGQHRSRILIKDQAAKNKTGPSGSSLRLGGGGGGGTLLVLIIMHRLGACCST